MPRIDKIDISEEQRSMLEKYAKLALRIEDIAFLLGMCQRTLYRRLKEEPELRVSLLKGRAHTKAALNSKLVTRALDDNNKDTALLIFACKTISGLSEHNVSDDDLSEEYEVPETYKQDDDDDE